MTRPDPRRDRNSRTNTSSTTGRTGEITTQIGGDGAEPAVNIGGGLTMDASGDVGLQIAPDIDSCTGGA